MLARGVDVEQRLAPDPSVKRRRRVWLLVFGGFVALLLLVSLYVSMIWLRSWPAHNPRWVRLPEAIGLVQIRWDGKHDSLLLAAMERRGLYAGKPEERKKFWTAQRFLAHPEATFWLLSPTAEEVAAAAGANPPRAPRPDWVLMGSSKRRFGLLDTAVTNLIEETARGAASRGRQSAPHGQCSAGLLLVSSRAEIAKSAVADVRRSNSAPRGAPPPQTEIDAFWEQLPRDEGVAFLLRDPANNLDMLAAGIPKELDGALRAAWAGATLLEGSMHWKAPDRIEGKLLWDRSQDEATASRQLQALARFVELREYAAQQGDETARSFVVFETTAENDGSRIGIRYEATGWPLPADLRAAAGESEPR